MLLKCFLKRLKLSGSTCDSPMLRWTCFCVYLKVVNNLRSFVRSELERNVAKEWRAPRQQVHIPAEWQISMRSCFLQSKFTLFCNTHEMLIDLIFQMPIHVQRDTKEYNIIVFNITSDIISYSLCHGNNYNNSKTITNILNWETHLSMLDIFCHGYGLTRQK